VSGELKTKQLRWAWRVDGIARQHRDSGSVGMSRLASRRTALLVAVIELVMVALVTVIGSAAHHRGDNDAAVPWLASCLGVGLLVSYKRPRHPMGWMLLGVSGFLLLSGIGATYSILDYGQHHGHLPFGGVAVLIEPSWAPAIALTVLCVLLYPDGKLPSARWRWPLRWLVCVGAAWQVGAFVIAASTLLTSRIRLDSAGDLQQLNNPSGMWAWWGITQTLFFLTVAGLTLAWVIGQVVGYRRLTGDRRIQQKWLLAGASVCVLSLVLEIPQEISLHPGHVAVVLSDLSIFGLAALPIAIGVGILKYRLYEIDRIISRTVSYSIVTALLAGTFVGLVVLTTDVLPFSSSVGVAASTLAAAALFNPLRLRVQRAVDRRFNRARYDAEATVAAFAQRLRDAVDLDTVSADLLATVKRAVEPVHATVWIRQTSPFEETPNARVERISV
jgi:hypothetical protein